MQTTKHHDNLHPRRPTYMPEVILSSNSYNQSISPCGRKIAPVTPYFPSRTDNNTDLLRERHERLPIEYRDTLRRHCYRRSNFMHHKRLLQWDGVLYTNADGLLNKKEDFK